MTEDLRSRAREYRDNGQFTLSGHYYTQSAFIVLANGAFADGNTDRIGYGLSRLLNAAVQYRRAGASSRAENRCRIGLLLCEDIDEHVLTDQRYRAVLQELKADFMGIGQFDDHDDAYDTAIGSYQEAGIPQTTSFDATGMADAVIMFTKYLSRFADDSGEDVDFVCDFTGRVAFKRRNIDQIVEALDKGEAPE